LQACRALLDSGPQASLISESCIQRLQLNRKKSRILVTGIGTTQTHRSRGSVNIKIKSDFNSFEINAIILNKLTTHIPGYNIDNLSKTDLLGLKLADPNINKSKSIDIILGADIFFNLLRKNQVKVSKKIIAQETVFGYILTGTMARLLNQVCHNYYIQI